MTRPRYADAMTAAENLHAASDHIRAAVTHLDAVPEPFLAQVEAIEETDMLSSWMAVQLSRLGDRIALDADAAVEGV